MYKERSGAGEFVCPLGPIVCKTARPPQRLFNLVFESQDGRAFGADSEEKHEPASDIDTVGVDSLKALDPERPIREADITRAKGVLRAKPMSEKLCSRAASLKKR